MKASAAQVMTDGTMVSGFGGAFGWNLGGQGTMGFANTRSYESAMCWGQPNEMPQIFCGPHRLQTFDVPPPHASSCNLFPVSSHVVPLQRVNKTAPMITFRKSHRG